MTTATITDRYPSRTGAEPSISDRLDPVVWGDGDGPLDAGELARYERDGFLVVPDALDPRMVTECLEAARELSAGSVDHDAGLVAEPDEDAVLRSVFELDRHPVFERLVRSERIAGVARQLLGSDVALHQSRLNLKRAFEGRGFPWHSDFETWHVEDGMPRMRAVSCSIALTDNRPDNGPLHLIPGSHRSFVSCPGRTPDDHHRTSLRRQEYGVPDRRSLRRLVEHGGIESFTGRAGSLVFFECNTMHGSADNITPFPRTSAFFVFNSVENRLVDPFGTDSPRPRHLAARDAAPLPS